MKQYNANEVEAQIKAHWDANRVYARIKERNESGVPYSFIDGPPYTSGRVHVGTALNKSLKDMILRYKRMNGFAVFDRAGYDMHGLPTELPTMRSLGLKTNDDIEAYGVDKFIEACRKWCIDNMHAMTEDFQKLGVWMDFENAYQPISQEYTSGVWFLIKAAHEKGRLYEGLRTLAWDPVLQTACAKHELDYQQVKDQSIYVKFRMLKNGKPTNRFLVIWTTTPWTIPFNMAVMVHPDIDYVIAKVGNEEWIVAAELAESAIKEIAGEDYTIKETIKGSALDEEEYIHPLAGSMPYNKLSEKHKRIHTVVLSKEFVDLSAGTGLVHCAPGCGPEDYEVGVVYDLPPFNTVKGDGEFSEPFQGLFARKDDSKFIEILEKEGAIVAKKNYIHDYPHSDRSKAPVIYRTTKQWFFQVSDLKEELLAANEEIYWQPQAAKKAFSSWLSNLRDNSITKQRYWGTAVPIWRNEQTGETIVVGSVEELEELSGTKVEDTHKPFIDSITIPSKKVNGAVLKRIPDVLDVWVDAGTASWNALDYPRNQELIKTHYPAQLIIEAQDQIRGWFNLMHLCGFLAFGKPSFSAVYMHGYINDLQGRKMSKSLGNYILPNEITDKYGADSLRLSLIKAANPGVDVSYGDEPASIAHKNLNVLWNTAQYLIDLCLGNDITPKTIDHGDEEEKYMLSRLEELTQKVNERFENNEFYQVPTLIEDYWLELSRTYIQLTREKSTGEDKQLVADMIYTALERILVMLAPVCPFITDSLWQQLGETTGNDESVHEQKWPTTNTSLIDEKLQKDFSDLQEIITAGLSAREKLKQGVRWPLQRILILTDTEPLSRYDELISRQLNVKKVLWNPPELSSAKRVQPNFSTIAKTFGKETQTVAKIIEETQPSPPVTVEGYEIMPEHVTIKTIPVSGFAESNSKAGAVYVDASVTPELIEEGFTRELARRVQQLRRDEGLVKKDEIELCVTGHAMSEENREELARKTNAEMVPEHFENQREEQIKDRIYTISCRKTI